MTRLDMDALTGRQRDVLSAIAVGEDQHHPPRVLAALAALDLIVAHQVLLDDHRPPVTVSRWEMPLDVHIQWAAWCAAWCAANAPDETL